MHPLTHIFHTLGITGSIRIRKSESRGIEYAALHDEITFHTDAHTSTAITLIKNDRTMDLHLKWDDPEAITTLIEENPPLLDILTPDPDHAPPEIQDSVSEDFSSFNIQEVTSDFLRSQWEIARNHPHPADMHIESFGYQAERSEITYINHFGSIKHQVTTSASYGIEYFLERENFADMESRGRAMRTLEPVSQNLLTETQTRLLDRSHPESATLTSGTYAIALENHLIGEFLEYLTSALSAENIRQNQSFLALDDLGKKIFSDFSLSNEPHYPHSAYCRLFDAEGITCTPLTLIENGMIQNLLVDTKNSRKLRLPATGNASISNLVLQANETVENPLLGCSFLFTSLMGFHTIDGMTGKFALEGEGYEIENGIRKRFVKNIALSSTIRDLFWQIVAIWRDTHTDGNIFVPTIAFSSQNLIV